MAAASSAFNVLSAFQKTKVEAIKSGREIEIGELGKHFFFFLVSFDILQFP